MSAVTLVIATYNHARFLPEALASALAQTLPPEIVVVDDGSTDDTPAVLARYADRVRVLRVDHGGLAVARNAGLAAARGRFVAFLDADDLLDPAKLETQAAILESEPELGWTFCDVRIEDVETGDATTASVRFDYAHHRLDGWIFPALVGGNFIPAMAPLVRRSLLERAGGFDPSLTSLEDWDLWLRLALEAPARYSPDVLATYRVQSGGMSRNRARMDDQRFRALDKLGRTRPDAIAALGVAGRRLMADVHNWFGYRAYAEADWHEARRRLAASLRLFPLQRRAPLMLGLAWLRGWAR
ncbi:MAG: glycosyltransferase [Candidatus Rokuibacteriota bacterium]